MFRLKHLKTSRNMPPTSGFATLQALKTALPQKTIDWMRLQKSPNV